MQRPLDANLLLSLVDDGIEAGTFYVGFVKRDFGRQNLSEGVVNLLIASGMFRPWLRIHNYTCKDERRGPDEWSIAFGVHINVRFC